MKKRKSSESLDSLNLYFQRIKKIRILSAEEERDLIAKAKAGDEQVRPTRTNSNVTKIRVRL